MDNGGFVIFEASHYAEVVLFVVGATVVFPITRTPLLKSYWRSRICSPKLMPDLYKKEGYAAMRLPLWDSYQRPWSKTVLSKDCALQKSEAAKL